MRHHHIIASHPGGVSSTSTSSSASLALPPRRREAAAAAAAAPVVVVLNPLKFVVVEDPSAITGFNQYDREALKLALSTMEGILSVKGNYEPLPASEMGTVYCPVYGTTPFSPHPSIILAPGEILVYVFARDGGPCNARILAYGAPCAFKIPGFFGMPSVGYINVCPEKNSQNLSQKLRFITFLHEIIHLLGFVVPLPPHMTTTTTEPTSMQPQDCMPKVMLVTAPLVASWVQKRYPSVTQATVCDDDGTTRVAPNSAPAGVMMIDSHWNPFIAGSDDIMCAIVSERSVLSELTLAFLESLGHYHLHRENLHKYPVVAAAAPPQPFPRQNNSPPQPFPSQNNSPVDVLWLVSVPRCGVSLGGTAVGVSLEVCWQAALGQSAITFLTSETHGLRLTSAAAAANASSSSSTISQTATAGSAANSRSSTAPSISAGGRWMIIRVVLLVHLAGWLLLL